MKDGVREKREELSMVSAWQINHQYVTKDRYGYSWPDGPISTHSLQFYDYFKNVSWRLGVYFNGRVLCTASVNNENISFPWFRLYSIWKTQLST